jgi:hypothetical protein
VHLDFHTSGLIPGIGARFSKRSFQEALKVGQVNSITLFAKCHHGWSYHRTKVGRRHPGLRFDLLDRQIEACRAIDVRCPIYLSAGLDEHMAMEHPEWVVKNRDGTTYAPLEAQWFKQMRFNSPYLDYLCDQIREVVARWPDNDGIFLDIVGPRLDYSEGALRDMRHGGFDPESEADVAAYAQLTLATYYERTNAAVRSVRTDTPVFHNGGHVPVGGRFNACNSHLELESLPTGGWGYDHFALSARYAITTDRDYLGMTGKFHTTWGEFGGFKRAAALRYECAAMLAYGAKCSIGDQLHPDGAMNPDTYRLIGEAYAEVGRKEPWCDGVRPVAKIALISAEHPQPPARSALTVSAADEGVSRMLLELHLPFVVLDEDASWRGCDLVILPETTVLTSARLRRLRQHLARGGRVLAAGSGLLKPAGEAFAIDVGARLLGRSSYDPDYLLATALTPDVAVRSPVVIHGGAYEVKPTGARVLVERRVPYFNRTWEHFCSHQHTPDAPQPAGPAALLTTQIAWFAHDIFSAYRQLGQPVYRDFVAAALRHLLGASWPVHTSLPTDGRINVLEQPDGQRYVVHLLYAPKSLRGWTNKRGRRLAVEIIEDLVPLSEVAVAVRVPRRVREVRLVPDGDTLPFTQRDGAVAFTVPQFTCHQMITLSYAKSDS